jgi:hypothetical protein
LTRLNRRRANKFEDQYETALVDLINQKPTGKPTTAKERPRGENVVDLMEALRRSVGGTAAETKPPTNSARKLAASQKEMLMAITGKKPKEALAKEAVGQTAAEVGLEDRASRPEYRGRLRRVSDPQLRHPKAVQALQFKKNAWR